MDWKMRMTRILNGKEDEEWLMGSIAEDRMVFLLRFVWMKICNWKWPDAGNGVDGRWRWNEEMRRLALQKGFEMTWRRDGME